MFSLAGKQIFFLSFARHNDESFFVILDWKWKKNAKPVRREITRSLNLILFGFNVIVKQKSDADCEESEEKSEEQATKVTRAFPVPR